MPLTAATSYDPATATLIVAARDYAPAPLSSVVLVRKRHGQPDEVLGTGLRYVTLTNPETGVLRFAAQVRTGGVVVSESPADMVLVTADRSADLVRVAVARATHPASVPLDALQSAWLPVVEAASDFAESNFSFADAEARRKLA